MGLCTPHNWSFKVITWFLKSSSYFIVFLLLPGIISIKTGTEHLPQTLVSFSLYIATWCLRLSEFKYFKSKFKIFKSYCKDLGIRTLEFETSAHFST